MSALSRAIFYLTSYNLLAVAIMATGNGDFDINFVELDTSKMIMTGDKNFAICNHHFPSNWRSVSVNGEDLTIATKDKKIVHQKCSNLTSEEKSSIENIKASLMNVIKQGPFNIKSETGFAKLTTYDRHGGSSVMGSGGASSAASSSSSSIDSNGMSISRTSKDSFIVAKSDFPFNWCRVFVNEDVDTVVYKDGRVIMLPQDLMKPDERSKMEELHKEVDKQMEAASKITSSLSHSMKNPFEFVSKALGGFFG